jgi:sugar phosphate isomerase/epimerase
MLSIASCYNYSVPILRQIEHVAAAGFTHLSLGGNRRHFDYADPTACTDLQAQCVRLGLGIDTIHSANLDAEDAPDAIRAAAQAALRLGAHAVVVHPVPFDVSADAIEDVRHRIARNAKRLQTIAEQATSVNFAIENVMPGLATRLIEEILAQVRAPNVGVCYDSSHEQVDGPREYDFIRNHLHQLFAVHLSDRSAPFVDHQIPGEGFIDFSVIADDLADAGFQRPLLFEVMMTHSRFSDEEKFLSEAFRAGTRIRKMIRGT